MARTPVDPPELPASGDPAEPATASTPSVSAFLAWCGGATARYVSAFPEELTRLAAIGATVLLTGLFATASSAYAVFTVFGAGLWVPLLALAWGATVFNIDRLIIMTMQGT